MARVPVTGFVGGAYTAQSWKASNQRCVNLYLEKDPEKGAVLYGTPGQQQIQTFGAAPVLAIEPTPSGLLVVTADGVYWAEDIQNGALINVSTVASVPSSYAIVAQAGDQMMMVNGDSGYAIDRISRTFTPISSPGFPANPMSCSAVDGYFLVHGPDSDVFSWSAPFDPLTWDALDFAAAENLNDKLQRVLVVERDVYLIGALSTEIWATVSGEEVFDRIEGTYIPFGTPAPLSAARLGGSLFFLGQDESGGAVVIKARGLQYSRVSQHAIETEISQYETISDAYSVTYQQRGHPFYAITFPSEGKTWVFDLSTELWHERSSQIPDPFAPNQSAPISYTPGSWSARCHGYFKGYNLVGSNVGPGVSILSPDYGSENGVDIVRLRATPHVVNKNEEMSISEMEIMFQPGVGNGTGTGPSNDPQARLRISRDGGKTFGVARSVSIGKQGDYLKRAKWNRLGRARDFVAEVTVSAQVPVAISGAFIEVNK